MTKECLYYNGEFGCYNLLDFDPNGLTNRELIIKIKKDLEKKGFSREDIIKEIEAVYLIDINNLEKIMPENRGD
jgi:hypothetical protein